VDFANCEGVHASRPCTRCMTKHPLTMLPRVMVKQICVFYFVDATSFDDIEKLL
jgi:hypothetical protein